MVTKLYQFHNLPPFCQKVVLRLSEHGDVIETQTVRFSPPKIFGKLVPALRSFKSAGILVFLSYVCWQLEIFATKAKNK